MTARAGVVVTGTEVLTGRVTDRNGPWLAERLRELGVDVAQVVVVGDRAEDLRAVLAFFAASGVDVVFTSGGLGPTADDLTALTVGDAQGRPSSLDEELEARISAIVEALAAGRGWRVDREGMRAGTRKQAMVPAGAEVIEPIGTAPGLVVPVADGRTGPPVVVLPGPPRELQGMWPAVVASPLFRAAIAGAVELRQHTLRLWGTPESDIAVTLRELGSSLDGLEITTCLRDGGELEIVTRYGPDAQPAYDAFTAAVAAAYPDTLFSPDGATVDALVAAALGERGWTVGVGESCTGGLLTGRLTAAPGSSAYVQGGTVAYSNDAKNTLLDVPLEVLAAHGAVSEEVAHAMARGARQRFGADVGVGVTGIAGPGGGTPDKPVGLVHLCVVTPERTLTRRVQVPGGRDDVRTRTTAVALHLLREALHRAPEAR